MIEALIMAVSVVVILGLLLVSIILIGNAFVEGFSENKRKGITGIVILVITFTSIFYAMLVDHEHQRQECEKFGGELRKYSNGYYYDAATKTTQEDYEYICVKE